MHATTAFLLPPTPLTSFSSQLPPHTLNRTMVWNLWKTSVSFKDMTLLWLILPHHVISWYIYVFVFEWNNLIHIWIMIWKTFSTVSGYSALFTLPVSWSGFAEKVPSTIHTLKQWKHSRLRHKIHIKKKKKMSKYVIMKKLAGWDKASANQNKFYISVSQYY